MDKQNQLMAIGHLVLLTPPMTLTFQFSNVTTHCLYD